MQWAETVVTLALRQEDACFQPTKWRIGQTVQQDVIACPSQYLIGKNRVLRWLWAPFKAYVDKDNTCLARSCHYPTYQV